jgi:hypothetical protein
MSRLCCSNHCNTLSLFKNRVSLSFVHVPKAALVLRDQTCRTTSACDTCCVLTVGHCSGTANITLPPSTLPSFVHLNLTCNVVSIQPGAVLEVFERAIMAFSRPTDPDHETGDQQVRADMFPSHTAVCADKDVSLCSRLLLWGPVLSRACWWWWAKAC